MCIHRERVWEVVYCEKKELARHLCCRALSETAESSVLPAGWDTPGRIPALAGAEQPLCDHSWEPAGSNSPFTHCTSASYKYIYNPGMPAFP